jgi:hypothetical protein
MNYRRGLQRIYAVLASVWIVAVFVAIFSGEFEPWKPFETPASQTVDFAPSELSTTPPTEAQRDGSPAPLDFSGAKFADQPTSANVSGSGCGLSVWRLRQSALPIYCCSLLPVGSTVASNREISTPAPFRHYLSGGSPHVWREAHKRLERHLERTIRRNGIPASPPRGLPTVRMGAGGYSFTAGSR